MLLLPPRELLRDKAYRVLLDAIVFGDLAPGDPLRDQDLATRLGLSRTPVREALTRLADEGLVETKANAYTRVAPLDAAAAREAAVVTQALHGLGARLAAASFTPVHAQHARRANRAFADALAAGDVAEALAADDHLHAVFLHAAGNAQLNAAIDRLAPLLRRYELLRFASPPGQRSVQQHRQLIDAAARGDAATAAALAEANWATLVDLIDAEPDPTPDDTPDTGARRAPR